jgi:hypothetical protein
MFFYLYFLRDEFNVEIKSVYYESVNRNHNNYLEKVEVIHF